MELEHGGDQVLELIRVEAFCLAVGVRLPEEVGPVSGEELVVVVVLISSGEGRVAGVQDEDNDANGEQVNNLTLVWLLGQDLGSHVAWGTDARSVRTRAITALQGACEAKVDDFNVIELVEEDVLWLQVSVREALRVDIVDSLEDLLEVVSADSSREGTGVSDVVE